MIRGEQLSKVFGEVQAVRPLDIHIPPRAVTAIMGGSGSGKTTLLRLLAGLERPTTGHVWFAGEDLTAISERRLFALREQMGMVFQYSALLNSLNVYDNVAFPLHEHTDLPERVIRRMVAMKLEQVGLRGFEHLMPSELSGGMAKRVAFARAMAMDPAVVFFDEPTSGLDPISAGVITELIRDTADTVQMTAVVVTHDVAAGLAIADHVILMWQGEVIARGTPAEIRASDDARVRQFIEGRPDGPIPFSRSTTPYAQSLLEEA
ncbi:MAG: ATP-binding cassette domain-containing protein [Zetaproteobacteria bacterium]|nr:MAG: ATP-binding cassette domain-containing protein [Zetaproteobacteria bacterium]